MTWYSAQVDGALQRAPDPVARLPQLAAGKRRHMESKGIELLGERDR
jgi:hypothetical protein